MNHKTIFPTDYLDVLFLNRNKMYGSYVLRRKYGERLGHSVLILLGVLLLMVATAVFKSRMQLPTDMPVLHPYVISDVVVPPLMPVAPPKPPKAQPASTHVNTRQFSDPIITKDPVPDDEKMPTVDDLHNSAVGTANINDSTDGEVSVVNKTGSKSGVLETPPVDKSPKVIVEQMPRFDGDMQTWLAAHIQYPAAARDAGVEGRVVIKFIVNEDGSVVEPVVLKGIGGGCDQEALRVVASMPHWKPGKQNGQAVRVWFTIPIVFMLQ